jgi:hypothetical protein
MNLKESLGHTPWYGILIYAAVLFMNTSGGNQDIKALIIYGILGLIFFSSGSLVRTTEKRILNNIKIVKPCRTCYLSNQLGSHLS